MHLRVKPHRFQFRSAIERANGCALWTAFELRTMLEGRYVVAQLCAGVSMSQTGEFAPAAPSQQVIEQEVELLHSSVKLGSVAQVVVAVIATIGLVYLLKLVLVTILSSLLLSYILEPPVTWLSRLRIPRWIGALIVVTITLALTLGLLYFSYNSAQSFISELPQYSATFRDSIGKIRASAEKLEQQTRSVVEPARPGKQPIPVRVEQPTGVTRIISENGSTILDVLLAIGFVPFLVYFMLVSKDHFHVATVRFFPKEHRLLAHRTVGNISSMIRSYIFANAMLGLVNTLIFTALFGYLGISYFYFIGAISGFVSLVPYLGVFASLLPPLAAGLGTLHKSGLLAVVIAVVGVHVLSMNVFYPKVIGQRLRLNPLAVSLSLLFWSWLWGAPGLILAIPILGAAKIIFDHMDPLWKLGAWLGETEKTNLP
jgi:predicted PurR-regulated permease PerM